MSVSVILVFGEPVEPGEFHDLIRELGGEQDSEDPGEFRLSRGSDHVWIYGPEGESIDDPEADAEYEKKLGAARQADVALGLSRSPGSPELALEIAEAAGRRWNVIVDNDQGGLFTPGELRDHPPGPSVFWEWPWGWS